MSGCIRDDSSLDLKPKEATDIRFDATKSNEGTWHTDRDLNFLSSLFPLFFYYCISSSKNLFMTMIMMLILCIIFSSWIMIMIVYLISWFASALKACSSEVMMLRCSRKYDIKTDSIVYANNQPYTRENYRSASIGEFADALFNFCRSTCVLKVDNAEYSLLTAIIIFSGEY